MTPVERGYDPFDHYWIVGGDESRSWSSRAGGYVAPDDAVYLSWRESGGRPSRIANAFELDQVLRQYGLSVGRAFSVEAALAALSNIDARKVKAALGRDDVSAQSLLSEDAERLGALARDLHPVEGVRLSAPSIEGAEQFSIEERLAKLETNEAKRAESA